MNSVNNPNRPSYRVDDPYLPPVRARKKRFPWWTLPVIAVCLGLLVWGWLTAEQAMAQYSVFHTMRAAVAQDIFYGPVYIDDTAVAGMTMDEARQALTVPQEAKAASFEVTLTHEGDRWRIASDNVPMAWDTESLLQKAYMIGRTGTLEERYRQVTDLSTPVHLTSTFTYDRDAVRAITDGIAQSLTYSPVDAAVTAFHVDARTFAFSDEKAGQTLDADNLYRSVIDHLDNGQYGAVIALNTVELPPQVTRAQLERDYTRIASFTTKTTSDRNRNTNISLSAHALNGQMIAAKGGTISFNETTGKRTPEKGYLEAGAIENGRTVQEYGGGVCQVSSTLFNALARANCEIVSRKPHAWPSTYVPRGEDATVDWPGVDLVMRNTSNAPMFLTAWYENETVTVEVYGLSLGDGVSIELESETTYSKEPTEVVYTYNASLPIGTTNKLKEPRTGYSVTTYKVMLQDGQPVSREKFYKSEYRMINEEYEYNDGNPPMETIAP